MSLSLSITSEKFSRGLSTTELNKVSSGFRKMLQKKFPEIIVDPNNLPKLDVISTGSYKLDALLRIGGLMQLASLYDKRFNGIYKINTIHYTGDYSGSDWKQEISCIACNDYKVVK